MTAVAVIAGVLFVGMLWAVAMGGEDGPDYPDHGDQGWKDEEEKN